MYFLPVTLRCVCRMNFLASAMMQSSKEYALTLKRKLRVARSEFSRWSRSIFKSMGGFIKLEWQLRLSLCCGKEACITLPIIIKSVLARGRLYLVPHSRKVKWNMNLSPNQPQYWGGNGRIVSLFGSGRRRVMKWVHTVARLVFVYCRVMQNNFDYDALQQREVT